MVAYDPRACRTTLAAAAAHAMSRLTIVAFALVILAGEPARAAEPAVCRMSGPWDMIAFEVKSWGRPVTSWRLLPNGSGSWTETVAKAGASFADYDLVWHELDAGQEGYRQVEETLSRLPVPAPDPSGCASFMTDLPYGTIRLTRGATTIEIAWNSGCMDEDYRAFVDVLKAADTTVAGWGRAGRIMRTESN
jgi:hypothetical protein